MSKWEMMLLMIAASLPSPSQLLAGYTPLTTMLFRGASFTLISWCTALRTASLIVSLSTYGRCNEGCVCEMFSPEATPACCTLPWSELLTLWMPGAGIPVLRKLQNGTRHRYTGSAQISLRRQKPVYQVLHKLINRARHRYTGFIF